MIKNLSKKVIINCKKVMTWQKFGKNLAFRVLFWVNAPLIFAKTVIIGQ
ncbi:MAG: hypothetical protein ACNYPH_07725 [Gammaproteobacteria bacterium WSBS_2016_MAG_OTU1]